MLIINLVIVDFLELLWLIIDVYWFLGILKEIFFNVKDVLFWYWNEIFLNIIIEFLFFICFFFLWFVYLLYFIIFINCCIWYWLGFLYIISIFWFIFSF